MAIVNKPIEFSRQTELDNEFEHRADFSSLCHYPIVHKVQCSQQQTENVVNRHFRLSYSKCTGYQAIFPELL